MSHVAIPHITRRSVVGRLGDFLLTLLAVGGSICMILVILGVTFNISIMMFRTGSMSPTITAGSIAFVREIPATEMVVGDVVTVDRGEGVLPVTHRVIEIRQVDPMSGFVSFTMQGDANDTPDPQPYTVDTIREVIFTVPGVAPVVQWFGKPMVLAGLAVAASALVVWAFWPRRSERADESPVAPGSHTALILPLLVLLLPAGVPSPQANIEVEHVRGQVLQLRSITTPEAMSNLSPGDAATWVIDVWADTQTPGDIEVTLSASGALSEAAGQLAVTVESCAIVASHDSNSTCLSPPRAVVHRIDSFDLARPAEGQSIAAFPATQAQRFLITGTLVADSTAHLADHQTTLRFTATGAGDQLEVGPENPTPPERLPDTGLGNFVPLLLLAFIAIATGIATTLRGSKKRE